MLIKKWLDIYKTSKVKILNSHFLIQSFILKSKKNRER